MTLPRSAIRLTRYSELDGFISAFDHGKLNLLVIIGRAGIQKSSVVRDAVGRRACWVDGNATAFGLYRELFRNQHAPIVIDDVDSLYSDRSSVRLLKSLCQTEQLKRVAWHSAETTRGQGIPSSFQTSSRVAIIANEWKSLNANVAAVEDRGHLIQFDPTSAEVHLRTASWFWDQEIYDFVSDHLTLAMPLSMRDYRLSWELKEAGLDWRENLLTRWGVCEKLRMVARLKSDLSFATENDRAAAFAAQEGGCRATYFNYAKKLNLDSCPPPRKLKQLPPAVNQPTSMFDLLKRRHGEIGNG